MIAPYPPPPLSLSLATNCLVISSPLHDHFSASDKNMLKNLLNAEVHTTGRKNQNILVTLPNLFLRDARVRRHYKCRIKTECKADTTEAQPATFIFS